MFVLIVILILIVIILSSLLILYIREVHHLKSQLEQLEAGSQMELTTNTRNPAFVQLYQKLNHIFSGSHARDQRYIRSQNQLKQSISDIAHDIRTPLTSASGYLQMLKDCTDSAKQLRYENIIEKRIAELKDMLEELFLYTKLTSEEFSLECRDTAVFPVLSECMIGLYHVFEEKGIEPDIRFEDEALCVSAAPEALSRIFHNLINNALLHGAGGLCIVQKGTTLTFMNPIENAKAIDVEQIFERFYKADQTRKKGSSGLGLAIVKELCLRMGGTVKAEIREEQKLAITVTFLPGHPLKGPKSPEKNESERQRGIQEEC